MLESNDEFKTENVIGMFLTLQLYQMTQPHSSLLFHGVGGGLWRCNPIASLTEALIILRYLGEAAWKSRHESRFAIVARLQEMASGLLLLRGAMGSSGGLLEKLIDGRFLDAEIAEARQIEQAPDSPDSETPSRLEASRPLGRSNTFPVFSPQTEKSRILREAFGSNTLAHQELRIDIFTLQLPRYLCSSSLCPYPELAGAQQPASS